MYESAVLEVEKVHKDAIIPKRQTDGAAGYDLHSYVDITIPAQQRQLISTGIKIKLPSSTFGDIRDRSGLSLKGIDKGAGTIDEDYRGEVFVLLVNNSNTNLEVKKGDRIGQLVVIPYLKLQTKETKLDDTIRGTGGFGSTGKN